MKIAIVRLSSLGDIILGMVSLQFIHRHLPGCSITWVADKRFADILDHQPDISQLIKLDLKGFKKHHSFSGLFREYHSLASAGPFDAVIDLHGMIKSAITARILGGKRYGFDRQMVKEPLSNLFYQQTFAIPLDMPAACRYATLVANSLGFTLQPDELSDIRPFLLGRKRIARQRTNIFRRNTAILYLCRAPAPITKIIRPKNSRGWPPCLAKTSSSVTATSWNTGQQP